MVRTSKPGLLPLVLLLALFIGALLAIHLNVASLLGREIADFSVLITFFTLLLFLVSRA